MAKAKLAHMLFCCICIFFVVLFTSTGCNRGEKTVQTIVIPNKSIAGVELGMTEEQVITVLGEPGFQLSGEEINKLGKIYDIDSTGRFTGTSAQGMERMRLFIYSKPPLWILINEKNKVERLNLSYCEGVLVKGYPFLKFKYLNQQELASLGEPSAKIRMRLSEEKMMSMAPEGIVLEYYEYYYDEIGLNVGFVFDKSKQGISEYFIGVNHIDLYPFRE